MNYSVENSEFVAWAEMETLFQVNKFHAVLCDPPYGIAFMGKEWDDPGGPVAFQAQAKQWGEAMLPLLYPGALVFMFAGTRMWHRLAAGMEDAGFHLWDTLMWLHGQGFPKARDISKMIDSTQGNQREVVGIKKRGSIDAALKNKVGYLADPANQNNTKDFGYGEEIISKPSEISAPWAGHKTPQLKPAWEPILCFRAPMNGMKYAELALKYGSGCLNVDAGRIEYISEEDKNSGGRNTPTTSQKSMYGGNAYFDSKTRAFHSPAVALGRFPANVVLDESSAEVLDKQTGVRKAGASVTGKEPSASTKNDYGKYERVPFQGYGDIGGASRFFYVAKVARAEREAGLENFEEKSYGHSPADRCAKCDKQMLPAGNGVKCECETPERVHNSSKNTHPTMKPIELTRWLTSLLLPPDSVKPRRLLVPFAGVASEMIGAVQAGWDEVVGIEMDAEYCKIAEARLNYHKSNKIAKEEK